MLTLQQVFDKAAVHLLTQNAKALDADGEECMYRAPDGKMCAVGALIEDAVYVTDLEGLNARQPELVPALLASGINVDDPEMIDLLVGLQNIHDTWQLQAWFGRLQLLARAKTLNTEAIDALQSV